MIRLVKKFGAAVLLLVMGVILGALLVRPAEVALGQDVYQRFSTAYPPSPCSVTVQSRIDFTVDGSSSGEWIATPPSPCTAPTFNVVSVPENTASCVQKTNSRRVTKMSCSFTAEHQTTTFFLDSIAGD
ncbi:MAG: hypothetical protein KDJ52_21210 [Anaerolineae bacterium]|nr:hypothetical protein [Anaerolineae bacterium]